jgi:hypothetical protein
VGTFLEGGHPSKFGFCEKNLPKEKGLWELYEFDGGGQIRVSWEKVPIEGPWELSERAWQNQI